MAPEFGSVGTSPRTAIVTGGAMRIGAAIVRALAEDGWHLLIHCHRSRAEADALAQEVGNANVVEADLARPDCAERIFAACAGLPPPGLLVNSAALFERDSFEDFGTEGWAAHLDTNARAPAFLIRAFAEAVPGDASGLVVNLLDAKLAFPNTDYFSYTLSKMLLAGVTELCARQLARRGIRVCGIAPAVTLVSGPQSADSFEAVHALNALERGVTVGDIVATLRYIVSVPTLTGEIISIDGGQRFLGLPRDVQFLDVKRLS